MTYLGFSGLVGVSSWYRSSSRVSSASESSCVCVCVKERKLQRGWEEKVE